MWDYARNTQAGNLGAKYPANNLNNIRVFFWFHLFFFQKRKGGEKQGIQKKRAYSALFQFIYLFLCIRSYRGVNEFAVIVSAFAADPVSQFQLMALRAAYERRCRKFPHGTPGMFAGLRSSSFWNSHLSTPPVRL